VQTLSQLAQDIREGHKHGMNLGSMMQCIAVSKGNADHALAYARTHCKTRPAVIDALEARVKAAVAPGTAGTGGWAAELVLPSPMASEYVNLISPLTLLGRINFRKVPFNVRFARADTGTSAGFVGEGNPIPISAMSFDLLTLGYSKLGAISTITNSLANFSSPDAAALIAADHVRAAAKAADLALINPAAAVPNVSPASITFGATTIASSGATSVETLADLKTAFDAFTTAGVPLSESVLIISEATALAWGLLATASGNLLLPQLNGVQGGNILGVPVVVSLFPITCAVLVHPDSIAVADAGVELDITKESSLAFDSAPGSPTTLQSLWQANMTGLRSLRYINWLVRRAAGVFVITGTPT
jgi:HK97 family phage major capsid protein